MIHTFFHGSPDDYEPKSYEEETNYRVDQEIERRKRWERQRETSEHGPWASQGTKPHGGW